MLLLGAHMYKTTAKVEQKTWELTINQDDIKKWI